MIQARGLQKKYGSLEVLKGIDLEIAKGEVVCIVGASGAGKTTLLQLLGTLDRPDHGNLLIANTSVLELKQKQLAEFRNKHLGFIFQFHQLLPEFTALENAAIPALIAKKSKAQAFEQAKELLDLLGLGQRLQHKPAELSGGEQQRVAVARALVNRPDVLLADEPSGNLDTKNAEELHNLFFELREKFQQTIVIVTHNPTLAAMSDRTLRMQDGKMMG